MSVETTGYKWELMATLKSEHRLFKDYSGRLSFADNSGKTPSTTEDGPLWIEPGTNATASGNQVSIPVICRGQTGYVGVEIADIPALIQNGITVTASANFRDQIEMWSKIMVALASQR